MQLLVISVILWIPAKAYGNSLDVHMKNEESDISDWETMRRQFLVLRQLAVEQVKVFGQLIRFRLPSLQVDFAVLFSTVSGRSKSPANVLICFLYGVVLLFAPDVIRPIINKSLTFCFILFFII